MKIDLLGWSSKGLRAPDIEIDLSAGGASPSHISLIQMPNGTGKTTTLDLLNAALSGEAAEWRPEKILQFRRRNDDNLEGQFIVKLRIDDRPLTFELTLDFEKGAARYRTTKVGSGGVVEGWEPPLDARRFLSPEFLRLFIFDGEFAHRLLDRSEAEAERAIDALCQLYLLEDISDFASEEWERQSKGSPKTASGLARYRNELEKKNRTIRGLKKQKKSAEGQLLDCEKKAAILRNNIDQRMASVEATRDEYAEALEQLSKANRDQDGSAAQAMAKLRTPTALHEKFEISLVKLKDNLDRLKLPENTSSQFFEELKNEKECICGREMTEGAREEITLRSKRYLDAAESGTINSLKEDIARFARSDGEGSLHEKLKVDLKTLAGDRRSALEAQQKVRALKKKLIEGGDEQLKQWQSELEELESLIDSLTSLLEDISGIDNPEFSLKLIEAEVGDLKDKIAEITNTVSLKEKTDRLRNLLDRATELARSQIKKDLVSEVNDRIRKVLVNDPLEIEGIEKSLRLAGQDGASVGQTLALGYTFLTSVLHRGNNDFPLVVDSPANPIDIDVRANVASVIPTLCSQFVGFTINTEREGFLPALERSAHNVEYLTLFRKTAGTERLMPDLPEGGVTQTDNAVLVRGPEYFKRFGLKSEEQEENG